MADPVVIVGVDAPFPSEHEAAIAQAAEALNAAVRRAVSSAFEPGHPALQDAGFTALYGARAVFNAASIPEDQYAPALAMLISKGAAALVLRRSPSMSQGDLQATGGAVMRQLSAAASFAVGLRLGTIFKASAEAGARH